MKKALIPICLLLILSGGSMLAEAKQAHNNLVALISAIVATGSALYVAYYIDCLEHRIKKEAPSEEEAK